MKKVNYKTMYSLEVEKIRAQHKEILLFTHSSHTYPKLKTTDS